MIKRIAKGCGNLHYCGEHPGTVPLFGFTLLGAMAGREGGIYGCLFGAGLVLLVFGPLYLYGAWDRARFEEHLERKAKNENTR